MPDPQTHEGDSKHVEIHVGDLVVNVAGRSVVGEVLASSNAGGGLHLAVDLEVWDTGEGAA